MDTVFDKVAGLDVHHKFITVGIRCRLETGKLFAEVREFGTMTRALMALADYLEALGVTHVAMESTGVLRCRLSGAAGKLVPPLLDPFLPVHHYWEDRDRSRHVPGPVREKLLD